MKKRNEAKHAALQAWQERYQTDPTVTQNTIAEAVGLSREYVGTNIRLLGWNRPLSVTLEAREIGRHAERMRSHALRPKLTSVDIFRAVPSIWAAGRGIAITTSRPHIEVSI